MMEKYRFLLWQEKIVKESLEWMKKWNSTNEDRMKGFVSIFHDAAHTKIQRSSHFHTDYDRHRIFNNIVR